MEGVATAHGCKVEIEWLDVPYGPKVNAKEVLDLVQMELSWWGQRL